MRAAMNMPETDFLIEWKPVIARKPICLAMASSCGLGKRWQGVEV